MKKLVPYFVLRDFEIQYLTNLTNTMFFYWFEFLRECCFWEPTPTDNITFVRFDLDVTPSPSRPCLSSYALKFAELATYAGDRDLRADMWRNLIGVTDTMVAGQLLQTALPDLLAASLGDEVVFVAGGGVAALAGVIGTVGGGSTASAIAGSRESRVTSLHAHDAFVLRNEALGMLADLLGHRESHANGRLHKMVQLVFHALARVRVCGTSEGIGAMLSGLHVATGVWMALPPWCTLVD